MGLASSKYDLLLNNKGYILIEESYRKQAQQPFTPRFSTGDHSHGDLSFWQFFAQDEFLSEGQEKFRDKTRYRQSAGWDLRDGKPRIGRGIETLALANPMPDRLSSAFSGDNLLNFTEGNPTTVGDVSVSPTQVSISFNNYSNSDSRTDSYAREHTATTGSWQFTLRRTEYHVDEITLWIIASSASGGNGYFIRWIGPFGALQLLRSSGNTVLISSNKNLAIGEDVVVRVTRNSSGFFELFINGVGVGTADDNTFTSSSHIRFSVDVGGELGPTGALVKDFYFAGEETSPVLTGLGSKFVAYDNALYTCWNSLSGTTFAFTELVTPDRATNTPRIVHQNAIDIAVWNRDGRPTSTRSRFLVSVRGGVLRAYSGQAQVLTRSLNIYATCVMPINKTTVAAIGTTLEGSGIPAIEIIKMSAESWTVSSSVYIIADGGVSGVIVGSAALDSDGTLYFASNDMSAWEASYPSRLFQITAADILAEKPSFSAVHNLSDFVIRGLFSFGGKVYLHGSRIRGSKAIATVLRYPSTPVWESSLEVQYFPPVISKRYGHGVASSWINLDNTLFLGMNHLGAWAPVLQLDLEGQVREVAAFNSKQLESDGPNILAIAEFNGQFYFLNANEETIQRTTINRGGLGEDFDKCLLELSEMGANTALIQKTLYSVTVEISEALPEGAELNVLVNDVEIGGMTDEDGLRKEIILTSELTASAFRVKLSIPQETEWDGYVKGVLPKFVPTQFKKWSWAFGIRVTFDLKLIDGSREPRKPEDIFADLEAAWKSNTPIPLVDVDGNSYTVLLTDVQKRRPLLKRDKNRLEALAFVEALEV